ncbi:Uncharacterised protein [Mycobacteroides abscessus]|nr:Uncharacterised protein [Mycobacteroides abscessus]CPV13145.1 Uncharacterised protein [Mycobacteroides abscessus]
MIRKAITTVLLLVGVLAGIYLTGIGILLQAWDESMSRFDQQPTTSSYLWWGVSALGLALITVCIRVGIRSLRKRPTGADARCVCGPRE